jgi:hypothetical protein
MVIKYNVPALLTVAVVAIMVTALAVAPTVLTPPAYLMVLLAVGMVIS